MYIGYSMDKLEEYFEKKQEYDRAWTCKKEQAKRNREKRETPEQLRNLMVCIHCQKPGGTIWTTTVETTQDTPPKKYKCFQAKCGCDDKCFNGQAFIQIHLPMKQLVDKNLEKNLADLEESKRKIIKAKNKNLFFDLPITEDEFKRLKDELQLHITHVNSIYEKIHTSPEQVHRLIQITKQFHEAVTTFKNHINDYKNNGKQDIHINNAIDSYREVITKLVQDIRETKYDGSGVYFNNDKEIGTLIQILPVSLTKKEESVDNVEPEVITWNLAAPDASVSNIRAIPATIPVTRKRKAPNNNDQNKTQKKQKKQKKTKKTKAPPKANKTLKNKQTPSNSLSLSSLHNRTQKKRKRSAPHTWKSLARKIRNKFDNKRNLFEVTQHYTAWWHEFQDIYNDNDQMTNEEIDDWKDKVFRKFGLEFDNDMNNFEEWWNEADEEDDEEEEEEEL